MQPGCKFIIFVPDLHLFPLMNLQKNTQLHQHTANKWSVILSFACAVHCILTPIIVIALPFAAEFMRQYHWIDLILISGVFVLGTTAILHGYKYHHQQKTPAYLFISGLVLLASAAIMEYGFGYENNYHHFISGVGGVLSGVGQLYNFKLSNSSTSST
jgi:hypothetical protein